MTGSRTRKAILVVAVLLSTAVPGTASAAPSGAAPGGVTCQYVVLASWGGGFTADLRIVNNGPTINGWTTRWTTLVPTSDVVAWSARMTQHGSELIAVNMPWNGVIRTGETSAFAWSARAPSDVAPTDITINGAPC